MAKLFNFALIALLATPAQATEWQCGRVRFAEDGIMTYRGKFALVKVDPNDYRRACWQVFDTYAQARAAQSKR